MIRRLGVPIGSRLITITEHGSCWRIWTAVANLQTEPKNYIGSYIELYSDGAAFYFPNEYECIECMEARIDNKMVDRREVQSNIPKAVNGTAMAQNRSRVHTKYHSLELRERLFLSI
jgi:hypothetical protein